jgi:hypothetical protein
MAQLNAFFQNIKLPTVPEVGPVSYTHLRAHETG